MYPWNVRRISVRRLLGHSIYRTVFNKEETNGCMQSRGENNSSFSAVDAASNNNKYQ